MKRTPIFNIDKEEFVSRLSHEMTKEGVGGFIPANIVENEKRFFAIFKTDCRNDLGDSFFNAVYNTMKPFGYADYINKVLKQSIADGNLITTIDISFVKHADHTDRSQVQTIVNRKIEPEGNSRKKTITIDTPCSVSDMESFLHIVSHEGHWHDAVVRGEDGKVVIEFEVEP